MTYLSEKLAASERRSEELERALEDSKKECDTLRSQLLWFENICKDNAQLEYLTGLSRSVWDTVWKFLRMSPQNVVSQQAAATYERSARY